MSLDHSEVQCSIALAHPDNNRDNNYLPCMFDRSNVCANPNFYIISADRWRVILRDEHPDYIHAVFINVIVYIQCYILCMAKNNIATFITMNI